MRRRILAALAVAFTACADFGPAPTPPPLEVLTPHAWSGGEVVLRSRLFAFEPAPHVVIGRDTFIAGRRLDDSTMAYVVPDTSGTIQAAIIADGPDIPVAFRVYGYRDSYDGPWVGGYILPLANAPTPTFLGNGRTSLVYADLRYNFAFQFPDTIHDPWAMRGPGPTPDPEVFILAHFTTPNRPVYQLWRLWPTPQMLRDSVPGSDRIAAQFGPGRWLLGYHHNICLYDEGSRRCEYRQYEEINGLRFSPARDRSFVYYASSYTNGMPVYSTATGDTAFTVLEEASGGGGAFSPDGDTLWLAGFSWQRSTSSLFALRAATGERLRRIPLHGDPEDVAIDLAQPYVYVLTWWRVLADNVWTITPELVVVERPTARIVATIRPWSSPTARRPALCYSCDNRIIIDPVRRVLYVVATNRIGPPVGPSYIARFDLMP